MFKEKNFTHGGRARLGVVCVVALVKLHLSGHTMASFIQPNPPPNVDMKPIECVLSSGHMVMNSK